MKLRVHRACTHDKAQGAATLMLSAGDDLRNGVPTDLCSTPSGVECADQAMEFEL